MEVVLHPRMELLTNTTADRAGVTNLAEVLHIMRHSRIYWSLNYVFIHKHNLMYCERINLSIAPDCNLNVFKDASKTKYLILGMASLLLRPPPPRFGDPLFYTISA